MTFNFFVLAIIWQISALHFTNKTLLSGVLLKDSPFIYDKQIGRFKNLLKVGKSYFIGVCANEEITIATSNKTIQIRTDEYGSFSLVLDFLFTGEITIKITPENKPLKIIQSYPVVFHNIESPFDVISDIDDTILVSYTADFFKRVGTLAFTVPHKRKSIDFTHKLLKEFEKQDARVFYVSKSESNFFGMLTSFIEYNNLPKGQLILTPYLKFGQLLNAKKKRNFKVNHIRLILKNSGIKKYVLFGDDSQRDMEIYSEIAKEFPEKVLKIYIRQTKKKVLLYQKRMWEKLKSTGVTVQYFKADSNVDVVKEMEQLKK